MMKDDKNTCPECGGYKDSKEDICSYCLQEWAEQNGAQCADFD
jgi:uncharacterized Zn ribbon protein